ncbi:MFS transporter [Herbidospora yilanensis]|uniref:MFS transporter n=1 Tax=Herbidospora yilanensis TaxID=354426 RepID=UPI000785B9A7|nr:MFS transporter [Herbidospora yilanensis]
MLSVDRRFGWVWAAYAVSAYGTWLGFGAFPLIAVLVLDVGPAWVSALSAAGLAVGAVVAVPLGPWVEFRGKRQVMVAADLVRSAALVSVPVAFVFGWLSFAQLVVVSVVAAAAKIAFNAAAGAYLKGLLSPRDLLVANGRLESTMWSASVVGPPLGGAAIGLFGPVVTVLADAVSYLVSAVCVRAIGGGEPPPAPRPVRLRPADLLDGWREIWAHRALRRLFCATVLFNGLLMATEPLLAVLLLDRLGFTPWQYGLVFALPCLGGLAGARLARRFAARFGQARVLRVAGMLRTCWPVWLAFVQPGVPGIVLVIVVQFGLVFCCAVFAPVLATYRLEHIAPDRVARTLTAWSVTGSLAIAGLTAIWGLLAAAVGPREAIAAAGALILLTGLSGKP